MTLTVERLREVLHYDPETGHLFWRAPRGRRKMGVPAGALTKNNPYIRIAVDYTQYTAHRLAWFYVHGVWPTLIDHINGIPTDNRLSNLRQATIQMNSQNIQRATSSSTHGYLGTYFNKAQRAWHASIYVSGRRHHLGYYATPEEASAAYIEAKRRLHLGCTI